MGADYELLIILSAATIGGFFRRWFGGGFVSSPRWLRVCSGFVLAGVVASAATESIWGLLAGVYAAVTWTMGHGSYMDMGHMPGKDDSILRWPMDLIFGPEEQPSLKRDLVGMALLYSLFTVPAGIALIVLGHSGWFLLPAGPLVSLAYWVAWVFIPWQKEPTVYGEYASGALIYGALALA